MHCYERGRSLGGLVGNYEIEAHMRNCVAYMLGPACNDVFEKLRYISGKAGD